MNIPNRLTLLRILLTIVFLFFMSFPFKGPMMLWSKIISVIVFAGAAVSDFFDGRIAKKRNMITDFGKLMDPIADKILVISAFAVFVQLQLVAAWMLIAILSREFLITSLRLFALNKGKVLAAGRVGKHKTFSQMVVIFLILGFVVFKEVRLTFYTWNPAWEDLFKSSINGIMLFIVALTLFSGFSYLWDNRKIIANI
ncbi:MAG: CDP-diacylglycerol--glycerol-3-phosphate 3-phosphatidyltransferase [Deltaproteobacteria bacterium]